MIKPIIKSIIACYNALYKKKLQISKQKNTNFIIIHGNITPETIVIDKSGKIKIKGYLQNNLNDLFYRNIVRNI